MLVATPLDRPDDFELARRCAEGDSEAFSSIYVEHGKRLKSVAYQILGDVGDAEDAVQESFLKLHRSAGRYSGQASLSSWLYRILINTCYDVLRQRGRRAAATPLEQAPLPPAAAVDDVKRLMLARLLADLPEKWRTVFILFEVEGFSHAEIAEIAGITVANSKWILFSAKKQLQEKWNHEH